MTWDRPVSHPAYKQEQREKNASIRALVDRIAERCPMTDEIKLPEPTFWVAAPPRGGLALTEVQPSAWEAHPVFTADQVMAAVLEAKAQERERASFLTEADLRLILDKLENYDDCGPSGEGWQSEKLSRLVAKLSVAIRSGHSITETQRAEE